MGRGDTFHLSRVGVYFGDSQGTRSPDPFFGGAGPQRATCTECGACMTGCRNGAKNMLTENYLYLAERAGARIMPMTMVTAVRPRPDGFTVEVKRTGSPRRQRRECAKRWQAIMLESGARRPRVMRDALKQLRIELKRKAPIAFTVPMRAFVGMPGASEQQGSGRHQ